MRHFVFAAAFALAAATAHAADTPGTDATRAIEAAAYDYIDGQLEGDVDRVTRSLHPDLAKRAIKASNVLETFPLRRMTTDELIGLTRRDVLKTPKGEWNRSVRILDVAGNIATVRVEAPWFVDHLQLGNFDGRWMIVNAVYYP
ncbi:MAG: nuclear transport factor 2 family protein [Sphingomonadaceae bacterium]